MTRTLAPIATLTALVASLLACSAHWSESATTNALDTELTADQVTVVEVQAILAVETGDPLVCGDLMIDFTAHWDGLEGHALHGYDAEGERIDLGELEEGMPIALGSDWQQVGDNCEATRLLEITATSDDTGALTFDILATDSSSAPGDEPKAEVTLSGSVTFAPTAF